MSFRLKLFKVQMELNLQTLLLTTVSLLYYIML